MDWFYLDVLVSGADCIEQVLDECVVLLSLPAALRENLLEEPLFQCQA